MTCDGDAGGEGLAPLTGVRAPDILRTVMVDIHCHILPGLDDGAVDESVAREMAEMAARDGITHIVATPHSNYRFQFAPETNRLRRDDLQKSTGDSLTILLGCDFHLSYENLEAVRDRPAEYTINGHQYLLVEFSNVNIPPNTDHIFSELLGRNLVPIITHPERNPLLSENAEQLRRWIQAGCLVQVTAASFLGRFGKPARKFAELLLRNRMVHFIATDAHNTTSRPPLLTPARQAIAAAQGEDVAAAVSEANPRAAVEGRELPWRPAPETAPARKWFSLRR